MRTIEWQACKLKIVDQTKLPQRLSFLYLKTVDEVVDAIKSMKIRGAPVLGVAAAFGYALGVSDLKKAYRKILNSRPTAVNIRWALERMLRVSRAGRGLPKDKLKQQLKRY